MELKIVGYMEGTDPNFLTEIAAKSVAVVPLSNGADNHGRFIGHLTKKDKFSVVVGYFHKVIPPVEFHLTPQDILHACLTHNIPVILVAPDDIQKKCRNILGKISKSVTIVDPEKLMKTATTKLRIK
jgi:hypothetical protein